MCVCERDEKRERARERNKTHTEKNESDFLFFIHRCMIVAFIYFQQKIPFHMLTCNAARVPYENTLRNEHKRKTNLFAVKI